jgi:RNA polymerase sigma-70 factor (ECF subfamily)
MAAPVEDWAAVLDRVVEGDRAALVKLGRLVASFLVRWRAQDLRDDWDDLVQETVSKVVLAARAGKLRDRQAVAAYIKTTARRAFFDRLKSRLGTRASDTLPWEEVTEREADLLPEGPRPPSPELRQDLGTALARLPERQREAVVRVYAEGCTYEEAAERTGIPLGTLKRQIRLGLEALRRTLGEALQNE